MQATKATSESTLILHGSARADGNTAAAVGRVVDLVAATEVVHLCSLNIKPYTYSAPAIDDFRSVVDRMLAHRQIVFATPVYWYAMNGLMKTLFDRFTDLIRDPANKRLGRTLAGRDVWLLATGTDEKLPAGFTEPFRRTCCYLDMHWKGGFYIRVDKHATPKEQDLTEASELAVDLSRYRVRNALPLRGGKN